MSGRPFYQILDQPVTRDYSPRRRWETIVPLLDERLHLHRAFRGHVPTARNSSGVGRPEPAPRHRRPRDHRRGTSCGSAADAAVHKDQRVISRVEDVGIERGQTHARPETELLGSAPSRNRRSAKVSHTRCGGQLARGAGRPSRRNSDTTFDGGLPEHRERRRLPVTMNYPSAPR